MLVLSKRICNNHQKPIVVGKRNLRPLSVRPIVMSSCPWKHFLSAPFNKRWTSYETFEGCQRTDIQYLYHQSKALGRNQENGWDWRLCNGRLHHYRSELFCSLATCSTLRRLLSAFFCFFLRSWVLETGCKSVTTSILGFSNNSETTSLQLQNIKRRSFFEAKWCGVNHDRVKWQWLTWKRDKKSARTTVITSVSAWIRGTIRAILKRRLKLISRLAVAYFCSMLETLTLLLKSWRSSVHLPPRTLHQGIIGKLKI